METISDHNSSSPKSVSSSLDQEPHGQQRDTNGISSVGGVKGTGASIIDTCAHGDGNLRSCTGNNVNQKVLDLTLHRTYLIPCSDMDTSLPAGTELKNNTHNGSRVNGNDQNSPLSRLNHSPLITMSSQPLKFEMEPNDGPIEIISHNTNSTPVMNGTRNPVRDDDNKDVTCGLGPLRCPSFLESKFANKKTFLIIFCITSVLQGMYQTYFVSILTTIEKLYQIQSKTIGIIMSATELSQIIGSLFLTYYAGQGNRPKWIGIGIIVFAVSSLLTSAPHFIFHEESNVEISPLPVDTYHASQTLTTGNWSSQLLTITDHKRRLCNLNGSDPFMSPSKMGPKKCDSAESSESRTQSEVTTTVLIIFFLSRFMIGIGQTALNTLGMTFMDDNVAPKESALYFGISIGVRIFGPVFGFLLGSICTSIYVDFPFGSSQGLDPTSPDWVGAWWLGALVVGFSLLVISIPMLSFPKRLPSPDPNSYCHKQLHAQINHPSSQAADPVLDRQREKLLLSSAIDPINPDDEQGTDLNLHHQINDSRTSNGNNHSNNNVNKNGSAQIKLEGSSSSSASTSPSIKDFPAAVKRLLKNEILLLRAASSLLHILPIAGLYTFLPKYLESQFQLTASKASVISGLAGILVMAIGIFSSGFFITKFKPSVRFIAAWIAGTALAYTVGMVILMGVGCPMNDIIGLPTGHRVEGRTIVDPGGVKYWSPNDAANPHQVCTTSCSCPKGDFAPVCTSSGVNYLSPCIAGCTKSTSANVSMAKVIYSKCKCLDLGVTAVNGYCDQKCGNLFWYIIIFSFLVLVHSTSEVGSMLLTLRCVEPQDKSMALGLIAVAVGLFGNVPCSIIYGAVVDSTCLFWESNCDSLGACRIYDSVKFRLSFHGLTAFIMLLAFIVDAIVWCKSSHIKFEEEEQIQPDTKKDGDPPIINVNDD